MGRVAKVTQGLALALTLKTGEPSCISPASDMFTTGDTHPHESHRTLHSGILGTFFHLLQFTQASLNSTVMMDKLFRVSKVHGELHQRLCYRTDCYYSSRKRVVPPISLIVIHKDGFGYTFFGLKASLGQEQDWSGHRLGWEGCVLHVSASCGPPISKADIFLEHLSCWA